MPRWSDQGSDATTTLATSLLRRLADPSLAAPAALAFLAAEAACCGPGWAGLALPALLEWLARPVCCTLFAAGPSRGLIAQAHEQSADEDRTGGSAGGTSSAGGLALRPWCLGLPAPLQPRLQQVLAALPRCPTLYGGMDEYGRQLLNRLVAALQVPPPVLPGRHGPKAAGLSGSGGSNRCTGNQGAAREWVAAALQASQLRYQPPAQAIASVSAAGHGGGEAAGPGTAHADTRGAGGAAAASLEPSGCAGISGASGDASDLDGGGGSDTGADEGGWWWVPGDKAVPGSPSRGSSKLGRADLPESDPGSSPASAAGPEEDRSQEGVDAAARAGGAGGSGGGGGGGGYGREEAVGLRPPHAATTRDTVTAPDAEESAAASPAAKRRRLQEAAEPAVPPGSAQALPPPPTTTSTTMAMTAGSGLDLRELLRLLQEAISPDRSVPPTTPATWLQLEARLEQHASSAANTDGSSSAAAAAIAAAAIAASPPLPPDAVLHLVRQLLTPRLGGGAARLLLSAAVLPAVAAVERVMPKPLLEALAAAAGAHPRPLAESVMAPAAQRPGLSAGQSQLLLKAATAGSNPLPRPLQALVLRSVAAVGPEWCEAHVGLAQGLVEAAKEGLDAETLAAVAQGICAAARSGHLARSVALCRLLLSLLTRHGGGGSGGGGAALGPVALRQLHDAASATNNFMTKPCLAKLQELTQS